jgi:hypothetical protein
MRTARVVLDVLRDETRRQQSQVKRDGRLLALTVTEGCTDVYRWTHFDWRTACRRLPEYMCYHAITTAAEC